MSNEITNQIAVELSETELDSVAGGQSLIIDNSAMFEQKVMGAGVMTTAGPGGATTGGVFNAGSVRSEADQWIKFVN